MMMKKILVSLFSFILVMSTACAEEPRAIVPPPTADGGNQGAGDGDGDAVILKSLIYSGKQLKFVSSPGGHGKYVATTRPCTIQFSMIEEDGEHIFVAQLVETIHTQKVPAMELGKYYLQASDGKYVKEAPASGEFIPALVAVAVHEVEDPDVNKIEEYSQDSDFENSMELLFNNDTDFSEFEEEVEKVLESSSNQLTAENLAVLNKMNGSTIRIWHGTHPDQLLCNTDDDPNDGEFNGFKLQTSTQEVEYKVEHEDHDHDHDHE